MSRMPDDQFERLVREHHAAVYRAARRVTGDAEAAADVAQDVFVRVLRGQVRNDRGDHVRGSLCWLSARLAQNAVRARRRRRQHEENAMPSERHDSPEPIHQAAAADMQSAVQQCVGELPDELRVPLELHLQEELTLAAIGGALRLSTSTVHGRVQRALQRLRTALQGRGFAIAGATLPDLVRQLPPPVVPVGLEAQLLATGSSAAMAAATAGGVRRLVVAAGLALAATVAVVAVRVLQDDRSAAELVPAAGTIAAVDDVEGSFEVVVEHAGAGSGDSERELAAAPAAAVPAPAAAASVPDGPMQLVLTGTVHDAAAWPVVDARVTALAAGGLKPFELGAAVTDHTGAFRLSVELGELRPTAIRLVVAENGVRVLEGDEIAVSDELARRPIALVLPAEVGVATERYEWLVTVQDEHGSALSGVPVVVYRTPLPEAGRVGGVREALAATDAGGVAALRGRRLGGKWLFVDGRPLGRVPSFGSFELRRGGEHRATVVLPVGGSLVVRATAVDGQALPWSNVWLQDEALGITLQGRAEEAGGIRFAGLADGAYTLRVSSDADFSPACVRGLRASTEPVSVRLKRRMDEREIGDHMAEIHGKVVDAVTGEELALGSWDVEVLRAVDGESTSPFDRVVPPGPAQRMMSDAKHRGFHRVGIEPGRHALVARVPGYATAVHEFEVEGTELRTGIVIALQRGAEVRGRVLDGLARPVAGAVLQVVGVGALGDQRLARLRAAHGQEFDGVAVGLSPCWDRSEHDGSFVLSRVPPGVVLRLCARTPDGRVGVRDVGALQSGDVLPDVVLRCQ